MMEKIIVELPREKLIVLERLADSVDMDIEDFVAELLGGYLELEGIEEELDAEKYSAHDRIGKKV